MGTYLSMSHEDGSRSLVHPFNGTFCRCWSAGWDLRSQSDQDLSLRSGDQPHPVFNRTLERRITRIFGPRMRILTGDNWEVFRTASTTRILTSKARDVPLVITKIHRRRC